MMFHGGCWRIAATLAAAGTLFSLTGMEALPAGAAAAANAVEFAGNADAGLRLAKLGLLADENRDSAAAVDFLTRAAAEKLPDNVRRLVLETLHENLLAQNDFPKAEELAKSARKAAEFASYPERIAWMNARHLTMAGKRPEALDILKKIEIAPRPGDEECRRSEELLARAFNAAGDYAHAGEAFEALITSAGVNGAWKLRALEGALLNALDAGKIAEAQNYLARIQAEVPTAERDANAARLCALGWLIQTADGKFSGIAPEFRKVAAATQTPDPILARIAALAAEKSTPTAEKESLEWWQYAFKLGDMALRPAALARLIRAQGDLGEWTAALESLATYFELFPTSPERWKLRLFAAEVHLKLKHPETAQSIYESVFKDKLASQSERSLAAEALAVLAQKAGQAPDAIRYFKAAMNLAGDDAKRSSLCQSLGEYLYLLGRYDEARELLLPLAERADAAALWVVQCDYQLKNFAQALERCEKLTDSPTPEVRRKARYLAALLLETLGRNAEAATRYLAFAEEFPKSEEAPAALFQAGELSLGALEPAAAKIFLKYAYLYPGENAANALYKAYGEMLFAKLPEAESVFARLEKEYPESKYTIAANFRKIDFLRDSGNAAEALAALNRMDDLFSQKDADLHAEVLYDRAILCDALKDTAGALTALNEVIEKYSDRPVAAQSYFLLGDLKSRSGDFETAANCFRQAEECKPGGELAAACAGRAADAAYALYARTRLDKYLAQALIGYETLLKSTALSPALRFQSMYKLARVAEDSGDRSRALKLYGEVLYYAVLAHRENAFYAPVWCAKSLQAALALLEPAAADAPTAPEREALREEAIRLLMLANELDLPDENIPARIERLRAGESLQKK